MQSQILSIEYNLRGDLNQYIPDKIHQRIYDKFGNVLWSPLTVQLWDQVVSMMIDQEYEQVKTKGRKK